MEKSSVLFRVAKKPDQPFILGFIGLCLHCLKIFGKLTESLVNLKEPDLCLRGRLQFFHLRIFTVDGSLTVVIQGLKWLSRAQN